MPELFLIQWHTRTCNIGYKTNLIHSSRSTSKHRNSKPFESEGLHDDLAKQSFARRRFSVNSCCNGASQQFQGHTAKQMTRWVQHGLETSSALTFRRKCGHGIMRRKTSGLVVLVVVVVPLRRGRLVQDYKEECWNHEHIRSSWSLTVTSGDPLCQKPTDEAVKSSKSVSTANYGI